MASMAALIALCVEFVYTEADFKEVYSLNRQKPVPIERRLKSRNIEYNFEWNQPCLSHVSKEFSFCHKLKFSNPKSLQPDGVDLWYFKPKLS